MIPADASMFSASTLASLDQHAAAFAAAQPFRHVAIDGFLQPERAEALLQQFPGFDTRYALNEMGEVGGKAVRTRVRELGPAYAALDDFLQTAEFLDAVSRITGIPELLYDLDYEGGGTHENRQGQGLDAHIDFNYHPRTGWHRRLNLIVYLNPQWEQGWGGNLQLHRDPWVEGGEVSELLPLFNRCVVFETNEVSWHGFESIRLPDEHAALSRRSFAIYLYTRERPPAETAPPHATVYVPEGMPADITVGRALDAEDHLRLRAGFARLRAQLRFLYQRETDFTAQIEALKGALSESQRAQRAPLLGYARTSAVQGLWADDWAARDGALGFRLERPLKSLSISLWVPSQIGSTQHLSLRCGDAQADVEVGPGHSKTLRLNLRASAAADLALSWQAGASWTPAQPGESGDQRGLAFKLLSVELEHA